jgi:hypothetical protein
MVFDENLAGRIRTALARKKGIEEKKMFGGIVFMLNGNMLLPGMVAVVILGRKNYRIHYRIQPKLDTFWTVLPTKSTAERVDASCYELRKLRSFSEK